MATHAIIAPTTRGGPGPAYLNKKHRPTLNDWGPPYLLPRCMARVSAAPGESETPREEPPKERGGAQRCGVPGTQGGVSHAPLGSPSAGGRPKSGSPGGRQTCLYCRESNCRPVRTTAPGKPLRDHARPAAPHSPCFFSTLTCASGSPEISDVKRESRLGFTRF